MEAWANQNGVSTDTQLVLKNNGFKNLLLVRLITEDDIEDISNDIIFEQKQTLRNAVRKLNGLEQSGDTQAVEKVKRNAETVDQSTRSKGTRPKIESTQGTDNPRYVKCSTVLKPRKPAPRVNQPKIGDTKKEIDSDDTDDYLTTEPIPCILTPKPGRKDTKKESDSDDSDDYLTTEPIVYAKPGRKGAVVRRLYLQEGIVCQIKKDFEKKPRRILKDVECIVEGEDSCVVVNGSEEEVGRLLHIVHGLANAVRVLKKPMQCQGLLKHLKSNKGHQKLLKLEEDRNVKIYIVSTPGSQVYGGVENHEIRFPYSMKTKEGLTISIVQGSILEQETDAIVNPTSKFVDLSSGIISKLIVDRCGFDIQKRCKAERPKTGLKYGEVLVTIAGDLRCASVYHVPCKHWKKKAAPIKKFLNKLVYNCLSKAASINHTTIAFPAIGSGKLGYPQDFVPKVLLEAFLDFSKNKTDLIKVLEEVVIVICDPITIQAFTKYLQNNASAFAGMHTQDDLVDEELYSSADATQCELHMYGGDLKAMTSIYEQMYREYTQNRHTAGVDNVHALDNTRLVSDIVQMEDTHGVCISIHKSAKGTQDILVEGYMKDVEDAVEEIELMYKR